MQKCVGSYFLTFFFHFRFSTELPIDQVAAVVIDALVVVVHDVFVVVIRDAVDVVVPIWRVLIAPSVDILACEFANLNQILEVAKIDKTKVCHQIFTNLTDFYFLLRHIKTCLCLLYFSVSPQGVFIQRNPHPIVCTVSILLCTKMLV